MFFQKKGIYILGFIISNGILKPDPEKNDANKSYIQLKTIKELRFF